MKIKYVEIENILSIKTMRLEFKDSGLMLLDGWNFDDNTANGAGKSAILNAISYGLFDEFPRKIPISALLRDGTKSGHVKIGVESGGHLYEVIRSRPNSVIFFRDGEQLTLTQAEFETAVKLNYNQYLISMYSAQTEGKKLISMNDSDKKDFFLQLMNLNRFADCKSQADSRLKAIDSEMSILKIEETDLSSKISAYRDMLVDSDEIAKQIASENLGAFIEKLTELQKETAPDVSKYDDLESSLTDYLLDLSSMETEIKYKKVEHAGISRAIDDLKNHTHDDLLCPSCNEELILGSGGVKTKTSLQKEQNIKIDELKTRAKELVNELNTYPAIGDEKQKVSEKIKKCKFKRAQELEGFRLIQSEISDLRQTISAKKSKIDSLSSSIKRNDDILSRIDQCKGKLLIKTNRLKELEDERQLVEAASLLFGPTGATAYIMDSLVEALNSKMSDHIGLIWPNASYQLQSFKENKSGEIRAKFSEKLIINGKEKTTGSLSGGEFRCLSLALDFAVIDVLESMFGIKLNPIMLDEPFNDLDAYNRERVIELLEKLATNRQIVIVDHASEVKAMFSNVIRVEKRGGISKLA